MFNKWILNFENNLFNQLSESTQFEKIVNGRTGAILVNYENDSIPIVRTTTVDNQPVPDSYICLFSCYNHSPNPSDIRKLQIKEKNTKKNSERILDQNSIVIFSTSINRKYLHKIVLESNKSDNKWLGITFRLSKTFVHFNNKLPLLSSGKMLVLANDDLRKQFLKYRKLENLQVDFIYPEIDYTISKSDLLPI
jgi:hypothetical protein